MCNQESRRLTCVHGDEDDKGINRFIMRVRRKSRNVPMLLLAMVLTSIFHAGHSSVWSYNLPHQVYIVGVQTSICENLGGLSREQKRICLRNPEQMTSVGEGARMAIKECQFQFQYRRWNCSIPDQDKGSLFEQITSKGTREAAFTYAISSAGVLWALARACAEGNLSTCSCSQEGRPKELQREFQWGGCGDNIESAEEFSKLFIDAGEERRPATKKHARTLMNLHNNKIGRMVVKEMSVIECKCHGVSGSCSLKTCWRQLSEFREVGNALHDKYDAAVEVELKRKRGLATLLPKGKRRSFKRQLPSSKQIEKELLYLDSSPDFCYRNTREGALGTRGRKCIKDGTGTESCHLLCCKNGYDTRIEKIQKRCKCKFYWCCQVRCKVCTKNVTTYTCK